MGIFHFIYRNSPANDEISTSNSGYPHFGFVDPSGLVEIELRHSISYLLLGEGYTKCGNFTNSELIRKSKKKKNSLDHTLKTYSDKTQDT